MAPAIAVRIHWNLAALRGIRPHEYLSRFALGGAVSALAGLATAHWGPVIGGLFLAFPAIFPAGATLLDKHERDKKRHAGLSGEIRGRLAAALDARGAAMGALALAAFACLIWKLLPRHAAALVLPGALALWLGLSILLWRLRKLIVHLVRAR